MSDLHRNLTIRRDKRFVAIIIRHHFKFSMLSFDVHFTRGYSYVEFDVFSVISVHYDQDWSCNLVAVGDPLLKGWSINNLIVKGGCDGKAKQGNHSSSFLIIVLWWLAPARCRRPPRWAPARGPTTAWWWRPRRCKFSKTTDRDFR